MRISIAMCSWNGERHLASQLGSIADQSRPPDELILCDDASTDRTFQIAEAFASTAKFPIRLRRNAERLGSNANFEQAVTLCTGELIFLADQDDLWRGDKIERIGARFEEDPLLACLFTDASRIDESGTTRGDSLWRHLGFTSRLLQRVHRGGAFDVLSADNYATGATMAFRTAWRESFLPIPRSGIVHDDWIALIVSAIARVDCDDARLTLYREHATQQVGAGAGAGGALRRLQLARATGSAEYAGRAARLELAVERLRAIAAPPGRIAAMEQRILHLRTRATLPRGRVARIPVIAGEVPRYFRYANSIWSIAKDLIW